MEREMWRPGNMLYPLPAVMVSCQRPGEKPNIITVAWAGTVCSSPAMVSISVRPNRYSYQIIKETGEFVINLTTEKLAYATDYCGVRSGKDVDKFKEMKLTPLESKFVDAPGIAESPVCIECKVKQIVELLSLIHISDGNDFDASDQFRSAWNYLESVRTGRRSSDGWMLLQHGRICSGKLS